MDAIVLAGGKGRRMGSVTKNRQKAALPFWRIALLCRILDRLLNESSVDRVCILTGHAFTDIHSVLQANYSADSLKKRVDCFDFPCVSGTLSRLGAALKGGIEVEAGCLVCGIDSLISPRALSGFCSDALCVPESPSLLFSNRLDIAPTHKIGRVAERELVDYCRLEEVSNTSDWLTDVGIRYFPLWLLESIARRSFENNVFIPTCIQELLASGTRVMGSIFYENWNHFAVVEDFVVPIAS